MRFGKKSVRWFLNQTPTDGCLIMFNAPVNTWLSHTYALYAGVLGCHVLDDMGDIRASRRRNAPRDIYIVLKGD